MKIKKRNGELQEYQPNKIVKRINDQNKGLHCEADILSNEVISYIYDGITTEQIDEISIKIAASKCSLHPDYTILASRLLLSNLYMKRKKEFSYTGLHDKVIINYNLWKDKVNAVINYERDNNFDFFGLQTLINSYLLPNEVPQHMYVRVALYLADTFEEFEQFYELLSTQRGSVATPILMNAGTLKSTLISCCLIDNFEDSLSGIHTTFGKAAIATSEKSGIGINITNVRSKDSIVSTTGGKAFGIVKYAKIAESYSNAFTQGKRAGSYALYLDIWHEDIIDFLELRLPVGDYRARTRELFTAVNVRNNFMRCLLKDEDYKLFCPQSFRLEYGFDINELNNEEFDKYYDKAVNNKNIRHTVIKAKTLWQKILESQTESGTPYINFIDNVNKNVPYKDNIKQSNLCIEVNIPTNSKEIAQCCLGSIVLPNNMVEGVLKNTTHTLVKMLNKVIDLNMYSTDEARYSGLLRRSIGIGVQGFADYCNKLEIAFDSPDCKFLTDKIFKTIYEASWSESIHLNKTTYKFDLSEQFKEDFPFKEACNTTTLALMPTAATSIITGCSESFEPYTYNLMMRTTLNAEYVVWNKNLINYLIKHDLWNEDIKVKLIENKGSVLNIDFGDYTDKVHSIFRTSWEYKQKDLIDLAIIRQKYLSMSQSMNLYYLDNDVSKMSSALIYGWQKGLSTGVYYTRVKNKNTNLNNTIIKNTTKNNSFITCEGGCEG